MASTRLYALLVFFAFFIPFFSFGQIYEPVKWSSSTKKVSGDEYDIIFKATIDPKWYVYSQHIEGDGPSPTIVGFDKGSHFKLVGKNKEGGHMKKGFDEVWEIEVTKFADVYTITQRVKILDDSKPVTGFVNFQTCDDSKCLAPTDYNFSLKFKLDKKVDAENNTSPTKDNINSSASSTGQTSSPNVENSTINTIPTEPKKDVEWQGKAVLQSNIHKLTLNGTIPDGFYIYSQSIGEGGPIPTTVNLDKGNTIKGLIKESAGKSVKEYDGYFKMDVEKLKQSAQYEFEVEIKDPSKLVTGYVDYMMCDNKSCTPLVTYFSYEPKTQKFVFSPNPLDGNTSSVPSDEAKIFPINNINLDQPILQCSNNAEGDVVKKSNFNIFLLGFVGGLLALLTPCVFPLIPLTVSFFTKSNKSRKKGIQNAVLYGLFIFMVYLILSLPFHLLDSIDPNILNDISTNAWLNVAFFVIFMFFAFSFFGFYDITLPSGLTNKVSSAESVGGVIGIFFMALTLALVSFSCTGPILGSLLAGALTSDGGAWQLTSGMAGFGLALALPFALFAAFPSWMNSLPKSGGWLNIVKVVLGFVEVALAFKFLSNADLVKHWGLLKIEPFLIIWILCSLGLAAYLFGFIKFPHDSKTSKISPTRWIIGALSLAFGIYMMTGFRYRAETHTFTPLKLLSGLAPPVGYSILHPNDCPQNLNCFHDLDAGLAYAKEKKLPVFLDFTGYACVNCRKMEEHVWPDRNIFALLNDKYVVISLYVDDKTELAETDKKEISLPNGNIKRLRTVGDKWAAFQTIHFNNNSQPWYALISHEGTLLNSPVGYTPDVKKFQDFLNCGLDAYKQLDQCLIGMKQ